MKIEEFLGQIIEIKDVALATLSLDNKPSNRIIDMMYLEDNCLFFLTARGKSLYKELQMNPYVSITTCKNNKAYSLNGNVKMVDKKYLDILFNYNKFMKDLYPGDTKNTLEVFKIYSWNGEFFDLNEKPIYRQSFSYNTEENEKGLYKINKNKCISCGKCFNVCPQKCIDIINKDIHENNCLRCGACMEKCQFDAIERL